MRRPEPSLANLRAMFQRMLALGSDRIPDSERPRLERYARRLEALASAHYRRSAMAACAACYHELERVARALDDECTALSARFWYGTALHGLGRHEEALIVLEDALLEGEHSIDEPSLYLLWTRASRAEIELPRPLAEIEATFHAIERALHECGVAERRSRLLVNRARLALSRGRLAQAIAYGEEALERQQIESSTYSIGAHYWPLIAAYTWAGELSQARRHLEHWQKHGADGRTSRVFMACRHAELSRREGQLTRSLAHAVDAFRISLATDEHQLHIFATHALVQAQLARGNCAGARAVLAWGLRNRHCEFGEHAHLLRLLVADLALAEARWLGDLVPVDPETGREFGHKRRARKPERALAQLDVARRRLQDSEARGEALDRLLDCNLRAYGLAARRSLLEHTRDELLRA